MHLLDNRYVKVILVALSVYVIFRFGISVGDSVGELVYNLTH